MKKLSNLTNCINDFRKNLICLAVSEIDKNIEILEEEKNKDENLIYAHKRLKLLMETKEDIQELNLLIEFIQLKIS